MGGSWHFGEDSHVRKHLSHSLLLQPFSSSIPRIQCGLRLEPEQPQALKEMQINMEV